MAKRPSDYEQAKDSIMLIIDFDLRTPLKQKIEEACPYTPATAFVNARRTLVHVVFKDDDETIIRGDLRKYCKSLKTMSKELLQQYLYVKFKKYLS